jgi:hypothetical protein
MSTLYGLLGINESDVQFVNTLGQRVVYDAVQQLLQEYREDLALAMSVFVEEETETFKERYKLPGGGRMQKTGGQTRSGTVKAHGGWDVAYPLESFSDALGGDDVAMAYMSVQELSNHLATIYVRDTNSARYEMLRALYNNTERTFIDQTGRGTLLIEPLANGDSVLYAPVLGSETEATENHYLESGYAASAISDTNNPFATIRDEIEEHFGAATGGENIAVFLNQAQTAKVEALTDFEEVPDRFVRMGDAANIPEMLPLVPGRILGRVNGCWAIEWRWTPAGYLAGVHLEQPAPLKKRVDPAVTGLGRGLQLVAQDDAHPLMTSFWRNRYGFGVGNRLNGVVMELGTGGSYTIPTAYQ